MHGFMLLIRHVGWLMGLLVIIGFNRYAKLMPPSTLDHSRNFGLSLNKATQFHSAASPVTVCRIINGSNSLRWRPYSTYSVHQQLWMWMRQIRGVSN